MQTSPVSTKPYRTELERVRTYVRDHYAEEMNAADLAKLAGFSKAHFQRIFHEACGETLREHIKRIRLEKSVYKLMIAGDLSVTDIAYTCGFSSSQSFARVFKAHYGIPPTSLKSDVPRGQIFEKKWQNMQTHYGRKYLLPRKVRPDGSFIHIPFWNGQGKEVRQDLEVLDMPSMRIAYIRTIACPGSDELILAVNHLASWAASRGLFTSGTRWLRAIESMPDGNGRSVIDVCVSVPEGFEAEAESGVNIRYLPAGEYGVYSAKFSSMTEIIDAWKRLTIGWWISSYSCRDHRPFLEFSYNNPETQQTWSLTADICLPITTLRMK